MIEARRAAALCAAMWLASSAAMAQAPSSQSSGALLTGRDLRLLAGATAASAALSTLDSRIARTFDDSGFHARHPSVKVAANRASLVTETALMITGGVVYGIARRTHDDGTADVALHTTEGVASTAMVIQVVRGMLGRGRPYVVDDDNGEARNGDPHEFKFLRGFRSYNSSSPRKGRREIFTTSCC